MTFRNQGGWVEKIPAWRRERPGNFANVFIREKSNMVRPEPATIRRRPGSDLTATPPNRGR